jgi:hypothetical protein
VKGASFLASAATRADEIVECVADCTVRTPTTRVNGHSFFGSPPAGAACATTAETIIAINQLLRYRAFIVASLLSVFESGPSVRSNVPRVVSPGNAQNVSLRTERPRPWKQGSERR